MGETEYTPTTAGVRINQVADLDGDHPLYAQRLAAFDRWLAEHDAGVERAAAEKAWDYCVRAWDEYTDGNSLAACGEPRNPYRVAALRSETGEDA